MSAVPRLQQESSATSGHAASSEAEATARLGRDLLPQLIRGVVEPDQGCAQSWNVVEALEILLDAGQLTVGRALAQSIQGLLAHDSRARLFSAYEALASIVIDGELASNIGTIERVFFEIYTQGHSDADRLRISLVRARALGLGVAMKGLPESELMTARHLIEHEYLQSLGRKQLNAALIAGLELIKVYLYAPRPEVVAADGVLNQLENVCRSEDSHPDLRCDLARFRYHIDIARGAKPKEASLACALRAELQQYGVLTAALGELTIARVSGVQLEREPLELALKVFEQHQHSAALCEAALLLAGQSTAKNHYARAQRFFARALESGHEGGSCYVTLLSLFGLFQAAWGAGSGGEAKLILRRIEALLRKPLCLSAFGLNGVTAYQLTRQYVEGEKLARRCLRAAKRGADIFGIRDQALQLLAGCLAARGEWRSAARYYGEAADVAQSQRCVALSAERRLEMIQASLMHKAQSANTLLQVESAALLERLLAVERQILLVGAADEALVLRARLEQLRAQVVLAGRDFVTGVKFLGLARELYSKVGRLREVALIDGTLGVALLEVGRAQGVAVLDEASSALQRSLEFFDSLRCPHIAWKLRFYLASAASARAAVESDEVRHLMWREVSLSWLDGALTDRAMSVESQSHTGQGIWDNEFAPHLTWADVEMLQAALRPAKPKKGASKALKQSGSPKGSRPRFRGQMH